MNPWIGIAAVMVGMSAGFLGLRWMAGRFGWRAELARKSVHVSLGLVCLSFPWIFGDAAWAVWVLAGASSAGLLAVRWIPQLREGVGRALHGVGRWSAGELWFAPAVALVFDLSDGRVMCFAVPVAILTLADAAGALAGTRWGRLRYVAGSGWKSVEGSAAFFFCAMLCVAVLLGVFGGMPPEKVMWISVTIGLLATMAEGLSDRGMDNVILPVGVFFLMERFAQLNAGELAVRCGAVAGVLAIVTVCARRSTLDGAALLAAGLLGYGLAVLGGWHCLLPVAGVFAMHLWTSSRLGLPGRVRHGLEPVVGIALATLPWVAARGWLGADAALAGVSLASMAWLTQGHAGTRRFIGAPRIAPLAGLAKGLLLGALPGLAWLADDPRVLRWAGVGALASLAVTWLFLSLRGCRKPGDECGLWLIQGALSLAAAAIALSCSVGL